MSKESLYSIPKAPIFRETFADEQTTRVLGGVPTSVTYTNGVASFNGSSSKVVYSNKNFSNFVTNQTFSIRIILSSYTPSVSTTNIADFRNTDGSGSAYIVDSGGGTLASADGTKYVNGVASSTLTTNTKEIVISGMTIWKCYQIYIGSRYSSSNFMTGNIELFEIYDYTLTANEVKNLYENKRYSNLIPTYTESFNASMNGSFYNKYDTTLTTSGSPTIVKDGNIWCANYEIGSVKYSRYLSSGLTGDKTLILWVKPASNFTGGSNLFTNGQFCLQADWGGGQTYYFSRTNFTGTYRFGGTIEKGKWQMIVVTTTSDGSNATIYKNGSSVVSGTITTPSGTSGAINIGNSTSGSGSRIRGVRVIDGILSAQEISQLFSNERKDYNV